MIKERVGETTAGGIAVTYYLETEQFPKGRTAYGVELSTSDGECVRIRDLSASREKVRVLLEVLIRNSVTPTTLWDVVEDWLA